MKEKTIRLFLIVSFFLALQSFGREVEKSNPMDNIIPPSPEASSLGKYGEFPVSLFSGTPSINIPLWNVKSRSLRLPINLSYHASGVKVEEQAGWVGLGWSLLAGGVITRSVIGLPDDGPHGYFTMKYMMDRTDLDPNTEEDLNFLVMAAEGHYDTQPDMYYYNFAGYSGKFVFDTEGNPHILEYENIKIIRESKTKFKVTTPDGNQYYFGVSLDGKEAYEESQQVAKFNVSKFISTWYLTEIVSPNNTDTISFNYLDKGTVDISNNISESVQIFKSCEGECGQQGCETGGDISEGRSHLYISNKKDLESISSVNGKISFVTDSIREDFFGDGLTKLNSIIVSEKDGSFIKRYDLNYGYFNNSDVSGTSHLNKRLKLTHIFEVGKNNRVKPPYLFEYNESIPLPRRTSKAQDHWGYYNGANNSTLVPDVYLSDIRVFYGGDREPNSDYSTAGIIKKITYPTGGYSEFEFEGNDTPQGLSGGVRVKNITTFDGINADNIITKTYEYKKPETGSSSGKMITHKPVYTFDQSYIKYFDGGAIFHEKQICNVLSCLSTSKTPLGSSQGANTGYTLVTEYIGTPTDNIGRTEYHYSFANDSYYGFPYPPQKGRDWMRGKLLLQKDFKSGTNSPSRIIENNYNFNNFIGASNYKDVRGMKIAYSAVGWDVNWEQNKYGLFSWVNYDILCRWGYLEKTTEKIYDETDPNVFVEKATDYKYDNPKHANLSRQIETNSDGTTLTTKYKYPYDFVFDICESEIDTCNTLYYETCYNQQDDCRYQRDTACRPIKATCREEYNEKMRIHNERVKDDCYFLGAYLLGCGNKRKKEIRDEYMACLVTSEYYTCMEERYPCEDNLKACVGNDNCDNGAYYNCFEQQKLKSDAKLKVIASMQQKNLSNNPIETQVWQKKPEEKLINSTFIEYTEFDVPNEPRSIIAPYKTYSFEEKSPVDNFIETDIIAEADSNRLQLDNRYKVQTKFLDYDRYGNPTKILDKSGIASSIIWGQNGAYPTSIIKNAGKNGASDEFGVLDYEPTDSIITNNTWISQSRCNLSEKGNAHTGYYSLVVPASSLATSNLFLPLDQNGKYIFSAWVKTSTSFGQDNGALNLTTMRPGLEGISPSNISANQIETKFGDTNGEWIYIEAEIDMGLVRSQGDVSSTDTLQIACSIANNDPSQSMQIDDVRFLPYNAAMKTYTYGPTGNITSVSDENSLATYYEYDDLLRLENIKDFEKNILKRIKYSEIYVDLDYENEGICGTNYFLPDAGVQGTEISYTVRDEEGTYLDVVSNKVVPSGKNFTVTCLVSDLENPTNRITQSFDVAVNHNVTGDIAAHELNHNLEVEFKSKDFCVCDHVGIVSHEWEIGRREDFNPANFSQTGSTTCQYEFEQDGIYDVSYKFTDQYGKIHEVIKSFVVSASSYPVPDGDGNTTSYNPLESVDIKIDGMFIDDRDRAYSTNSGSMNFDAAVTGGAQCTFEWYVKTTSTWELLSGSSGHITISDTDGYNDFNIKVVTIDDDITVEKEKTLILKFL